MNNKISIRNRKFGTLTVALMLAIIFALLFAAMLGVVTAIRLQNLSGEMEEISGEAQCTNSEGHRLVTIGGQSYTLTPIESYLENPFELSGEVKIFVPKKQIASSYRWVMGIETESGVAVDWQKVLADKLSENTVIVAISAGAIALALAAAVVIVLLRRKTPREVEADIADALGEFTATQQEGIAQKKIAVSTIIYSITMVLLLIFLIIAEEKSSDTEAFRAINIAIVAAAIAATATEIWLCAAYFPKKEREFYAKNFPFDLDDYSKMPMNRKMGEEMSRQAKEKRQMHPDRFMDYGNGLLCDFCEDGIKCYTTEGEDAPTADEIFGAGGEGPEYERCVENISYDKLNFIALPHYRKKTHVFAIVIKSRIADEKDFLPNVEPAEKSDLHFPYDVHLAKTLEKYSVKVENLDTLLDNAEKLMKENCPKAKNL